MASQQQYVRFQSNGDSDSNRKQKTRKLSSIKEKRKKKPSKSERMENCLKKNRFCFENYRNYYAITIPCHNNIKYENNKKAK